MTPQGGPKRPAASPLRSRALEALACARSCPSVLIGSQVGVPGSINCRVPLAKSAFIVYIYRKVKEAKDEISIYSMCIYINIL